MSEINVTVVGAQLTPALQAHVEQKLEEALALLSSVTEVTVDLRQSAGSKAGQGRPYKATIVVATRDDTTFTQTAVRPGLYAAFELAAVQLTTNVRRHTIPKTSITYPRDPTQFRLGTVLGQRL